MIYVCLWSPRWAIDAAPLADLAASLLEVAPRVSVDGRGVIWADARGLPAPELARALVELAGGAEEVRAGVSAVPVAAELAARAAGIRGSGSPADPDTLVAVVEPGRERDLLAPLPLDLLDPDPRLRILLDGLGVRTCGELAGLSREAVEVRLGAAAGALWRLARADDRRILFRPIPRERPQASMDFVEYEVRDAARLVFTANALLGSVCSTLESRGERARSISLSLGLASGGVKRERLRSARPTADRDFWIRRLQGLLDRTRLTEPVASVALEVDETEPRSSTQGDLFDRGFATASAVEEAVARLLDEQGPVFVEPESDGHPLAERRTRWVARTADAAAGRAEPAKGRGAVRKGPGGSTARPAPGPSRADAPGRAGLSLVREGPSSPAPGGRMGTPGNPPAVSPAGPSPETSTGPRLLDSGATTPALTLQLLRAPRPIGVRIAFRGVQVLPESYLHAGEWKEIAVAAGPDRVSGGRWEETGFARDYFRCITGDGRLVWLFRDLDENRWYLHGWWE